MAGRGIGFGLGRPLCQQAERLLGGGGHRLFDVAQILFDILLDGCQTGLEVFAPSLDFSIAEVAFGNGLCGRNLCRLGGAFIQNLLGYFLS